MGKIIDRDVGRSDTAMRVETAGRLQSQCHLNQIGRGAAVLMP